MWEAIINEKHRETRSWLASELSEMKDKECLSFLRSLFDAGMIDPMITTYDEVLDVYAGRYESTLNLKLDTKDPANYFREREVKETVQLPSVIEPYEEEYTPAIPGLIPKATMHGKKIGRNDPCPCGSGKKYKKCCINKYQAKT